MTDKRLRKNDLILILFLGIFALVFGVGYMVIQGTGTENGEAVVTIDGKEYGRFPLDRDETYHIDLPDGSYNILMIQDGKADMTEASCPDKICVNHRAISKKKESIVCLPNEVIITIENGEESDLDAVGN